MASPVSYQTPARRTATSPSQLIKLPGPCFACGKIGHTRSCYLKTLGSPVLEQRKWHLSPELPKDEFCDMVEDVCVERIDADVKSIDEL